MRYRVKKESYDKTTAEILIVLVVLGNVGESPESPDAGSVEGIGQLSMSVNLLDAYDEQRKNQGESCSYHLERFQHLNRL